MKVLCPNCQHSVTVNASEGMMRCEACQFETTISRINTTPGITQSAVVADMSGQMVGPYQLESCLGMGGMGVVYRAVDTRNDTVVAVKLLSAVQGSDTPGGEGDAGGAPDQPFIQRFQREVAALKRLNHPNIVKLLDAGVAGPLHYLVTEFIDGEDLSRYLRSNDMPVHRAMSIAHDVCEALAYAHARGVIHRDIKPANIMVAGQGARVLDFGLARVAHPDLSCTTLTRTDIAMGTFNYLSPEQRINAKDVDGRTDIFSLGVVAYEMLTGALPMGNFDSPAQTNAAVSPRLNALVMRCLQNNPDKRYESAGELEQAMARIQQPPSRRRLWIPGIAAVLLLGGAMALFALWPEAVGKNNAEQPAVQMERPRFVPREIPASVRRRSTKGDTRRLLPETILPPRTTDTAPTPEAALPTPEPQDTKKKKTIRKPSAGKKKRAPEALTQELKIQKKLPPSVSRKKGKKILNKPAGNDFDPFTGK